MANEINDPHVFNLLARVSDVLEAEPMGNVLMVVIAITSNVIRQANPEEKAAIISFLAKHYEALREGTVQ